MDASSWSEAAQGRSILAIEQEIAYSAAMQLNQLILRRVNGGWQAIVKASKGSQNLVAYLTCDSYGDAVALTAEFAEKGGFSWYPDRYPPNIR